MKSITTACNNDRQTPAQCSDKYMYRRSSRTGSALLDSSRYKEEFNDGTQKLSDQLNLAHVARKKMKKKKLRQTKASAHLVLNRFRSAKAVRKE